MAGGRIAVRQFLRAEPTEDGRGLKLVFVDEAGATVALSVPLPCLGALMAGLPRQAPPAEGVNEVLAWQIDAAGSFLTLTLQTPEGARASFLVTPGQIAGMATLAAYGPRGAAHRLLN